MPAFVIDLTVLVVLLLAGSIRVWYMVASSMWSGQTKDY